MFTCLAIVFMDTVFKKIFFNRGGGHNSC